MAKPNRLPNQLPPDFQGAPTPPAPSATAVAEAPAPTPQAPEVKPAPAPTPQAPEVKPAPVPSGPRKFRVSLPQCQVLVINERGVYDRQPHLDVDADDEADAIRKFGKYNGIPMKKDPFSGAEMLDSIHRVSVVAL